MKRSLSPLFLALIVTACSEPPAPTVVESPGIVIQNNQLVYPAGHPQLAQLVVAKAKAAQPSLVEFPAKLVWNETRTQRIYSPFNGRVSEIRADVGMSVVPQQILANLTSPDFGQAQAEAARANIDVQLGRKNLARQRELLEAGVSAKKEVEQAEADLECANAELQRAHGRTQLYGSTDRISQRINLSAGIRGVVVERNLNPGQELRADQSGVGVPPLFVLSDPTRLWALIDVRESDAGLLRTGARITLFSSSLPGEQFSGVILSAADAVDPSTRTVKVRAEIDNPDRRLKAEMLATAQAAKQAIPGLVIPSVALILKDGRQLVFIQRDTGVFEPRVVEVTQKDSMNAVVSSGITEEDRIVVENVLLLARQFALLTPDETRTPAQATTKPVHNAKP